VRVEHARWWTVRPAQNLQPKTYVCPLCDGLLHATSEHMLIAPEGDVSKRRHAHTQCVLAARRRKELTLEDEWRRAQPRASRFRRSR
jgi:hypothetical protein